MGLIVFILVGALAGPLMRRYHRPLGNVGNRGAGALHNAKRQRRELEGRQPASASPDGQRCAQQRQHYSGKPPMAI